MRDGEKRERNKLDSRVGLAASGLATGSQGRGREKSSKVPKMKSLFDKRVHVGPLQSAIPPVKY